MPVKSSLCSPSAFHKCPPASRPFFPPCCSLSHGTFLPSPSPPPLPLLLWSSLLHPEKLLGLLRIVAPTMTRDAPWAPLLLLFLSPCLTARPRSLPQATKQFLEEINKWTGQYNVSPLSWNVAVKFLMARKFDVLRAIELFHSYRVRERGQNPHLRAPCSLGPPSLPLLLFPLLSPLQVLSSWKILFQPRWVAMEMSPIPVSSPALGATQGVLLARVCCPQSIPLCINNIDPRTPFPTRCCKAAPFCYWGECWRMLPWSRGWGSPAPVPPVTALPARRRHG